MVVDTGLPDSGTSKVIFDGNPIDLERVLAHVHVAFMLNASSYSTDSQKSAFLASHFRGGALDWLGRFLTSTPQRLEDYEGFVNTVKNTFFLDANHIAAQAQTELAALRHTGDLLEFLQTFEHLCERAGCRSDVTKLTLLFPKLNSYYHEALISGGATFVHYSVARTCLTNIYDRTPDKKESPDTRRRKARCKKCGKRGHTGTQCSSTN